MIVHGEMMVEELPVGHRFHRKSGQAMAELLVGLVGIMLLIVGLQQISIVSRRSFETYVDVRTQLANQLADPSSDFSGEFIFVDTVEKGKDTKGYTGDDRIIQGDDSFYTEGQGFLDQVDYSVLEGYLWDYERENPYYRLSDSSFSILSESFSMHYGVSFSEVEMVPFLRKVLGRDTLHLKSEAWMPAWDGIMEVVP